jgi:hypothetical protein
MRGIDGGVYIRVVSTMVPLLPTGGTVSVVRPTMTSIPRCYRSLYCV